MGKLVECGTEHIRGTERSRRKDQSWGLRSRMTFAVGESEKVYDSSRRADARAGPMLRSKSACRWGRQGRLRWETAADCSLESRKG